ncbi:MAG: hypothetical protein AAGC63_07565 [Propionicimonas sp.]|nr:hypothetical protein [Propionicimonas sp.]
MSDQTTPSPDSPQFLPPGQRPPDRWGWDPMEDAQPPSGHRYAPEPSYQSGPQPATPGVPVGGYPDSPAHAGGDSSQASEAPVVPAATENVGRGLAFSLVGIALGVVASTAIYQAGFLASITSALMAFAAGWLYAKGAGAPPRAGAIPLVVVIILGVVLSLFTMLGWTLYGEIATDYPGASAGEILPVVFDNLLYPPVWSVFATDALIFVAFAALGTFGVLRQLHRAALGQ